jgi:hypothetical protein
MRRHKRGEEGVVLVIWAVALTALVGFLALAVNLGNLVQSGQNVQNAADAAAVSGATILGATWPQAGPSLTSTISIPTHDNGKPQYHCDVQLTECSGGGPDPYVWLDGYYDNWWGFYSYYVYQDGWWERIVPNQPSSGEVQDGQPLLQELHNDGWQCTGGWPDNQGWDWWQNNWQWCTQISNWWNSWGQTPSSGSITSDAFGLEAVDQAAHNLESLVEHDYGVDATWSACSDSPPAEGFSFVAWGPTDWGLDCIAYKVSNDGVTLWVDVDASAGPSFVENDGGTTLQGAAWAGWDKSTGRAELCSAQGANCT